MQIKILNIKEEMSMKLHMQVFIALGLGIKRNWHIFLGLILGIILGIFLNAKKGYFELTNPLVYSGVIATLNFVGQAFIRLIQMVVIPLIFSAIVIGITSIGDSKQLSKLGIRMLLYYGIITVLAVIVGTFLSLLVKPGIGVQSLISAQSASDIQGFVNSALEAQSGNLSNIFLNLIPQNPIAAFAQADMIPIIIFIVIFSIALSKVGEINRPVISFFESIFASTMKVTDWIMYLAAPGVFALTASAIASYGITIFDSIAKLAIVLLVGFGIQFFIIYPLLMKIFSKVPVMLYYSAIAEAMMVAFGTASSSATLPLTIACCEKRGISNKVASFVLPLGATLNMDGSALFQVVCVFFLMQAYGVALEPVQIILIAALAIVSSSTCAGIPGAGLITIALILNGLGLTPNQLVEGFAFLFAFERIFDMFRTLNNVTSDAIIAGIIADNENEFNYDLLLNAKDDSEDDEF